MAKIIHADMIIADIMEMDPGTAPIFLSNGLHCFACPASSGDTVRDACEIHGLDCDMLLEELNDYFEEKMSGE